METDEIRTGDLVQGYGMSEVLLVLSANKYQFTACDSSGRKFSQPQAAAHGMYQILQSISSGGRDEI